MSSDDAMKAGHVAGGISPCAWIGLAMLIAIVVVGALWTLARALTRRMRFRRAVLRPVGEHLLGLDFAGRDVLSRFLWGGRTAIFLALAGTTIGFAVGSASAWSRRTGAAGSTRCSAAPRISRWPSRALILALLLLAAFGTSLGLVILAIAVTTAPGVARIARAAALEIVDLPYVEAARARGERPTYVMAVEILPT